MSPQKKTAGGGGGTATGGQNRKAKGASGQKENSSIATAEQNNPQNSTANSKKHNIANSNVNNNNSTDQLKTEKEKPHAKPTAEQIRIAQILEFKNGTQDPTREKVILLMELTERSEEDACLALYECDNDVEQAVVYLLENLEVGALVTNTKKKKNKSVQDGTGEGDESEQSNNREASRGDYERKGARGSNRGGGMGANRGRSRGGGGGRDGRDSREIGENREDRGKPRGRGTFSTRGGRGRGTGNRGGRERSFRPQEQPQEIDNWDPTSTQIETTKNEDQTWGNCGDWDNEEYTGSLAETKVFTPSTQQDISAPPGLEQIHQPPPTDYNSTVSGAATGQYGELHSAPTAAQLRQALGPQTLVSQSSVPLSAEQSQYFNTLGSQSVGPGVAYQSSVQYNYNDQQQAPRSAQQQQQQQQQQQAQQQAQRTRARVPPPSKIPASAVEMPDVDLPAYLDVQFGGLDFGTGTEESYETDKFTQGIDQSTGDDYTKGSGVVTSKGAVTQGLGGLQPSQLIQNSDSISSSTQADLSSAYAQRTTASMGTGTTQSALDQLKPGADIYASAATGTNAYQNLSYQSATQKGYQAGYGNNAYNATQTSSNYPASSNNYGYNQSSYQQQSQGTQSAGGNVTGQQTQTGANGNVGAPNQNNSTGYMSSQYPNQSGYQSQQNSYQNQNVYASNNNDRFSGSINSLTSKLKGTQGTFDSSANTASSGTSAVSASTAITTSSINTASLGGGKSSTTKTSSSQVSSASNANSAIGAAGATTGGVGQSAASGNGASNVVQNIPLVSSYMPAFYQQSYLPFEDMQLVQPRTMTYYYDQTTPTSLAGVRSDGTTPNLAYPTMSADGRFARTDNNSSPVQSQQTGSSQQLMNIPPYAYFYGTNVVPGGFQQFPQIYSQMPATNPTASQFAKQSAYSGGYGSTGYDTLNQTTPEYNKTTYQSSGQPSKGHSASSQSGTNTDIASSSMYNKSHVTLNKVNSYDKQSFHSGTPPPFNLGTQAGSQTQAYQQHLYLPAMAPHHNINMHQPIHQMDGGRINNSRRDTSNSGQRQQSGNQSKTGSKPAYSTSTYWNTQN